MSIEFEGDFTPAQFRSRTVLGQPQMPGMAAWLIKKGIIKSENGAKGVLIGIVFMNIILTFLVIYLFVF